MSSQEEYVLFYYDNEKWKSNYSSHRNILHELGYFTNVLNLIF